MMMYIVVSVVLYTIPFVHPALFYWTIFICFIPFFVVVLSCKHQLFYSCCWTVLLMTLQWLPLITIIIKQGNHPLKYCIPVFCLLLVAIGGLVAGILSTVVNIYVHSLYIRLFLHTMVWWLFIEWIYRYMFITFGYTLSYPLIPLAICVGLLNSYAPMAFFMFCLLLAQMAVAAYYCDGNKRLLIIVLIGYAPFFIGLLVPTNKRRSISMKVRCGIPPPYSGYILDDAQEIAKCIIDARGCNYLIFPESSFCYDCLSDPTIIQMWQEYIDENQTVIIGTHAKRADRWQVTACRIAQQKVSWHDKSFLLPLAECIPEWVPSCCKEIFLHECELFYPANVLKQGDTYDLLLCAELFLSKDCWRQMANGTAPIIVLASDSWCVDTWLPDLMMLFARFKAIEWGRVIVYCSQSKFEIINGG